MIANAVLLLFVDVLQQNNARKYNPIMPNIVNVVYLDASA